MPLSFNTGTTGTATGVAHTANQNLTIPAGVAVGDVMVVSIGVFTFTPTGADFTLTPAVGTWSTIAPGVVSSPASGGLTMFGKAWTRVATAADPGSVLTFAFTGTQGSTDQFWWAIDIASYTGAGILEGVNSSSGLNVSNCANVVTGQNADWGITLGMIAVSGSGSINGGPTGTATIRENASTAGVCNAHTDSNASVGGPGTTIGGNPFSTTSGGSGDWWVTFTLALTPPLVGVPPYLQRGSRRYQHRHRRHQTLFMPLVSAGNTTPSDADTFIGTEGTPTIGVTDADTGAGADAGEKIGVSSADTGSAAEASSIVATLSSSDTGTGAEGTPQIGVTSPDTATGTEGTGQIAFSSSDTGSAAEGTPTITLSGSDAATAAEASSINATLASSDTGAGTEGTPTIAFSSADTGHGTDGGEAVNTSITSADAFTGTEGSPVQIALASSDTGSAAEASSINATLSSADTGSGTEGTGKIGVSSPDTATGTEGPAQIALAGTDTGTGTEGNKLAVASADAGAGTEGGQIALSSSDAGAGTEAAGLALASADVGTLVDAGESVQIVVNTTPHDTDAASFTDTQTPIAQVTLAVGAPVITLAVEERTDPVVLPAAEPDVRLAVSEPSITLLVTAE